MSLINKTSKPRLHFIDKLIELNFILFMYVCFAFHR